MLGAERAVWPATQAIRNDAARPIPVSQMIKLLRNGPLAACVAEDRVLVTLDLDFSDIRQYPPGSHRGIWVLRPARQTFNAIFALVEAGLRLTATERTAGQLWVIDERRVRIRE